MANYDQAAKGDGYTERLVAVNRTTTVVKGGKNFHFNAITVVGDGKGRIGIGRGKSKEVPLAIQKSLDDARKNMRSVVLNNDTLHHEMRGKHGATWVFMKPASDGTGIIAGGAMRAVFEVLGVKNVLAKIGGSTNPINVVRATLSALTKVSTPEFIASKRGKQLEDIIETK
jgi:small subunit ribosomal protein S5